MAAAALLAVVAPACGADRSDPGAGTGAQGGPGGTTATTTVGTATAAGDDELAAWPAEPAVPPVAGAGPVALVLDDGTTRTYHPYVPSTLPEGPVPLVIALHGGLGSGRQLQRTIGFDGVAEANGFLVAYPDGTGGALGRDGLRTWNAGRCCGPAADDGVDDVAFLRAVVEDVASTHDVDPARVYLVGHSNGGMLALRAACEAADVVAGVGVVGASLEVDRCQPSRPVSVASVHGEADRNHPLGGGQGEDGIARVAFRPAQEGIEVLAGAAGCALGPPEVDGDLTVRVATGCDDGVELAFTTIAGASHAWPGSTGAGNALVAAPYAGYDASAEVWAFLAAHPRP